MSRHVPPTCRWLVAPLLAAALVPATARAQDAPAPEPPAEAQAPSAPEPTPASDPDSSELPAELPADLALPSLDHDEDQGPKLALYGFADANFFLPTMGASNPWTRFVPDKPTFSVGNLDLYFDATITPKIRSLIEVRLLFSPHGNPIFASDGTQTFQDNTVMDPAEWAHRVRWNALSIQRAWLEYQAHPLLTIRAGRFITPYGIWVVDHGSPTLIAIRRPFIIRDALLPEFQTGVELYGARTFSWLNVEYHLALSNGRGPIDEYQDLDSDKAITGRLLFSYSSRETDVRVGFATYQGKMTAKEYQWLPTATGVPDRKLYELRENREQGYAADLRLRHGSWHLQSEAIAAYRLFKDGTRPLAAGTTDKFESDAVRYGIYGLLGYRTSILGTMPYLLAEYYRSSGAGSALPIIGDINRTVLIMSGLNIRPRPEITLKIEYVYGWFPTHAPGSWGDHSLHGLQTQVAWAF